MGAVWRLLAFLVGICLGMALLATADLTVTGFWVPVSLALAVTWLTYSAEWLRERNLAGWIAIALGFGVCGGWLASDGLTKREVDLSYLPALAFEGLSAFAFVGLIARTALLPAKQRAPGWWMVLLILMGWGVSIGSSSAGGADHMVVFFHKLGLSLHDAEILVPVIRKTIHFTFYGLMGLFGRKAALAAGEKPESAWKFGLLLTLAIATFDETRQMAVPGRGASVFDILIDMTGAVAFNTFSSIRMARSASRKKTRT